MLDLIGRAPDEWVPPAPFAPPQTLPASLPRIDEAATRAGRDPSSIRRVTQPRWVDRIGGPVIGSSIRCRPGSTNSPGLALLGMDAFVFWPPAADDPIGQTELFATEVAPAVRAALDA
jgi:hypothetical protein